MSSGVPRILSGSSIPARRSWTKPRDETIRDAARGSCWPRSGVGSFLNIEKQATFKVSPKSMWYSYSRTKKGLSARTTGSLWERYDSYLKPRHQRDDICTSLVYLPKVFDVADRDIAISLYNSRFWPRNSPSFRLGPFLQSLLEYRAIACQKIIYSSLCLFMFPFILQGLKGCKISSAGIFQGWNGKLGKLVLRRESPITLRIRVEFSDWVGHVEA